MNEDVYKNYLTDLGRLVADLAVGAKQQSTQVNSDFAVGYLAGFHRIVSLMQQQAESFCIPLEAIGLAKIDADEDLV
ncbi:hypothetical protein AB4Y64_11085 [Lysobacter sp. TAF61]|uniref:hypothetical protein n=1 Tax=Lysobacter sp. TAF61 TaxID=3233072 RepID=UPI003F949BFD